MNPLCNMTRVRSEDSVAQRGNLAAGALGVGDGPAPLVDWVEADRFSFEDSDRFEEDSLCSWSSEPESLCNNWRGWKKPALGQGSLGLFGATKRNSEDGQTPGSLCELAARTVASHIPFELVEHVYPPVPEQLQLRIAFWSFPDNEEDIRLYSCLANGSADEFLRGDQLYKSRTVKDPLQIGFHLSASVVPPSSVNPLNTKFNVAVTFDRRRITSCNCTCSSTAYWCSHVVAVCLHRIHMPNQVCLRAPVSESLSRLHREQLQKFAQYLISELPQQILPTAQRLLDELLSSQPSAINSVCGAPDPTAGASILDQTSWYLDEKTLHDNIKKILIKFCVPAPIVFSDVNYLSTTAPPAASEWSSLLRPLRGREPEGMWNLLSIVREMFKRNDRNAIPLLEIITKECMACEQILVWWFNTKVALHNGSSGHGGGKHGNVNSNSQASQHACSSLCDEIVVLWRLAALNPGLGPEERVLLRSQFRDWHSSIIQKVTKSRGMNNGMGGVQYSSSSNNHLNHGNNHGNSLNMNGMSNSKANGLRAEIEVFPGFRPALEASFLDWDEYPIPGVTYQGGASRFYHCPFTCFRHADDSGRPENIVNQVNSSQAVLNCQHPNSHQPHHVHHHNPHLQHPNGTNTSQKQRAPRASPMNEFSSFGSKRRTDALNILCQMSSRSFGHNDTSRSKRPADGNRSSVSSEGFCENETDADLMPDGGVSVMVVRDPDPQGGGSHSSTSSSNGSSSSSSSGRAHSKVMSWNKDQTEEASGSKRDSPGFAFDEDVGCFDMNSPTLDGQGKNTEAGPSNCQPKENVEDVSIATSTGACEPSPVPSGSGLGDRSDTSGPRRPSKDDSISSSTSESPHNSGDEYTVYYYDPKSFVGPSCSSDKASPPSNGDKKDDKTRTTPGGDAIFDSLKKMTDPWEILFARAEGLHAHGHGREACLLGVQLAEEMLANPPALMIDVPPLISKGKRKKVNPASHQLSCLATATLSKCAFLCTVLAENRDHFHLAFKVGMFGLEMARPPASTKPLEVKLANQETELVSLLKRIPLSPAELSIIREQAQLLRDGALKSRGEALLPIVLTSFIFDALVLPNAVGRDVRSQLFSTPLRCPSDETLGFEAAVAAMGLKANVSEADHPLLCEGTRRQRGDLAIALLCHYKDDPEKLARIMEKLLDRDVHQLLKTPLVPSYYSNNPPTRSFTRHRKEETRHGDMGPIPSASGSPMDQALVEGVVCGPGSRPHSSTSAELEQGLGSLSLSNPQTPTTTPVTTSGRSKESGRYKGKRTYPSIPNQPSESGAHFMFELAKTVLTKAGGNSSTSLFTQPTTSNSHHGPHRALHMCAFQIGLYALGLHNCVSPNWLSRTYSSHVSWITGQAMEIGAPAISFLIDTWEGHLTPPEAASIADRASRGCDPHMVAAAAELALSFLPHSHALNPSEIHRAILQCKEQSDEMLEHSCLTVENAAKGGGVYPEVLFQVAKYWYELFLKHSSDSDSTIEMDGLHEPVFSMDSSQSMLLIDASGGGSPSGPANGMAGMPHSNCSQPMVVTAGPPQNIQPLMSVPFNVAPYSFAVQNLHPMQGAFNVNQRTVTIPPPSPFQMYLSPPSYQQHAPNPQAPFNNMPAQRTVQYFGTAVALPTQTMNLRQGPSQNQMQPQHQMYDIRGNQGSPQQPPQSVPVQVQLQVSSNSPQQLPPSQQMQPVQVQQLQSLQQSLQSMQSMQVQPVQQMSMQQPVQQMPIQPPVQQMSMQSIHQQIQSLQSMQGMQGLQQTLQQSMQVLQQGLPQGLQQQMAQAMQAVGSPQQVSQVHQLQPQSSKVKAPGAGPGAGLGPGPGQGPGQQQVCEEALQMAQLLQLAAAAAAASAQQSTKSDLQLMVQADNQLANSQAELAMVQVEPQQVVQVVQASGPIMVAVPLSLSAVSSALASASTSAATISARPHQVQHRQQQGYSQTQLRYLLAAYRVGMLALETLARRVHDDRPQAKYARNPPYGEDVKWLLRVAKKLGNQYLHQFCVCAVSSIVSPFVLHDVALEAAQYLSRHNPNLLMQHLRSAMTPLVQKCQQMYIQCLHQKLYHLTSSDYEDFVNIVISARAAFQITPDGAQQFKEWLQSIKRSKSCKKELWTQINSALQSNNK